MKTIIAGSRDITDYREVLRAVAEAHDIMAITPTEIVSGGARGVDRMGERWAEEHEIPVTKFIPDWSGPHGKGAGMVRNAEMAVYADAAIILWDGTSRGTFNMISNAQKAGLLLYVKTPEETHIG